MERKSNYMGGVLLLLKNPILIVPVLIIAVFGIVIMAFLGFSLLLDSESEQGEGGYMPIACQQGDLDMTAYSAPFSNAGSFTGKSKEFLNAAKTANIDPVLLSAIAFHETGRGSSNMVKSRNNPGGLYNSRKGEFFTYKTLSDGITAMALNLSDNYIEKGLFTLDAIGAKYAPIGAANDPTGLNVHWVPNISAMVAQFGGLTMNCELIGFESGFTSPLQGKLDVTSKFGIRVHPISGIVKNHAGTDFACNTGDTVMAVLGGTIVDSKFHKGWGNYVLINHGDKFTLYAHFSESYVAKGDTVSQGMPIGACGSTGSSTNPHLHLEIHINRAYGKAIDPLPYFQGSGL
jgi:murein DD-endopeptidase MepM/ murein hydrolase activator NlpD